MSYYDEVADLMSGVTSPGQLPEEPEDPGVQALQQVGGPPAGVTADGAGATDSSTGTGRYSQNGNELPAGLYERNRPGEMSYSHDLPDAQVAAMSGQPSPAGNGTPTPQASTPGTVTVGTQPAASAGTVTPGDDDPGPTATDPNSNYIQKGLAGELSNLTAGDRTARMMEAQPTEQQIMDPLLQRQQGLSVPTPVDKANKTAPSVWQRIGRGIQAYARGGVLGPVNPAAVGATPYGAGNKTWQRDEAVRQGNLTALADRIKATAQAYKDQQARLKEQGTMEDAQATGYSRLPTGVATVQNAATDRFKAQTERQRADQESPEAKDAAEQAAQTRRAAQVADPKSIYHRMPSWAQWGYITTGKAEVSRPPQLPAEVQMYDKALSAWKNDPANKGKPVTAEVLRGIVQDSKGTKESGTTTLTPVQWKGLVNDHDKEYADADKEHDAALKAAKKDPTKIAQAETNYATKRQQLQDRWNQRFADADPEGVYARQGRTANPATTAATTETQVPGGGTAQQNETAPPITALKPGRVTKFANGQEWKLVNGRPYRVK